MSARQILALAFYVSSLTTTVFAGEVHCPGGVETIRYHSLQTGQIGISVKINGSGPFEFLLDTGALITIVEPSLAAELQLAPAGHAGLVSDVRRAVVDMVRLDSVAAGRSTIGQSLAAVQTLAQIQAANPKIRGILGENFLARFDLLIDHAHGIVCLDTSGEMRRDLDGERIPLITRPESEDDSGLPEPLLIDVQLANGPRNVVLRLDSGANVPQLYVNTLDTPSWVQRGSGIRGQVTGSTAQYFALMPPEDIRIGKRPVRDLVFATPVKERQNVGFKGEDGLLPTALFKRVFISYAGSFVILNPR